MATTKILQIKNSHKQALEYIMDFEKTTPETTGQQQAIDYITNDGKTEDGELVTGYNCHPEVSVAEFAMTQELARCAKGNYRKVGGADIKAHHVIQSFSPEDNVTPEQAHQIGRELMQELTGGQHEYVIATHVDKEHIHNHIVFNATSFYSLTKFRCQPYKTAAQIRSISDKLCAEHGLSVLPENSHLKSNYKQYQKYRSQTTYRVQLRKRLNFLLETERDLDSFLKKATELDVDVNLDGQHATYQYGAQKRRTRDDKLSDDQRFTKEGLIERLKQNNNQLAILEAEILLAGEECQTYDQFEKRLKEKLGVTSKRNRQGQVVYHFQDQDQSKIPERAVNSGLTVEKIKQQFKTGQGLKLETNGLSVKEVYDAQVQTTVADVDSPVTIDESLIEEVTKEGLLIKADDGTGKPGHIFIDSNHVDFLPKENKYQLHLGDQFNYYFMDGGKQTNYFLKGELLLRQLETKVGIPTKKIEVSAKNIQSISSKGVSLTFEKDGIQRLFIPKEYVHYDKIAKKVEIELSDNWNYYYQKEQPAKGQKKVPYDPIKGKQLFAVIENQVPTLDAHLTYQLNRLDMRLSLQQTKEIAGQLSLLRTNNVKDIPGLNEKLSELTAQVDSTRSSIQTLEETIKEYNMVAKYLVAFQTYVNGGTWQVPDEAPKMPDTFTSKERADMYKIAGQELDKRGIDPHVDIEKVVELVKDNQQKEKQMKQSLEKAEHHLSQYKEVKSLIKELNKGKVLTPQQAKDRRQEKER